LAGNVSRSSRHLSNESDDVGGDELKSDAILLREAQGQPGAFRELYGRYAKACTDFTFGVHATPTSRTI
jgi:hypothetical protein